MFVCVSSLHQQGGRRETSSGGIIFILPSLCAGVPKGRRGEVWLLLSHQHRLRHRLPQRQHAPDTPYHDLLKQLTAQQHAILVDLGGRNIVK